MVGKAESNGGHALNMLHGEVDHEGDDYGDVKPKKKRRVIKTGDKKYECPEADCGKSYSRAEHLYRHQLNHTPKQIYHCDFPGCDRHFVRADLCARHKERHTAKGSHLQRKDAFMNAQRTEAHTSGSTSSPGQTTVGASPPDTYQPQPEPYQAPPATMQVQQPTAEQYAQQHGDMQNGGMHLDPQLDASAISYANMNGTYNNQTMLPPSGANRQSIDPYAQRSNPYGMNQTLVNNNNNNNNMQAAYNTLASPNVMYQSQSYPSPSSTNFRSPTAYAGLPSLQSYGNAMPNYAASMSRSNTIMSPNSFTTAEQQNGRQASMADFGAFDFNNTYSMPVFGNDFVTNRSPPGVVLNDDWFTALLGNNESILDVPPQPSPPGPEPVHNPAVFNTPLPKLEPDGTPATEQSSVVEGSGSLLAHGLDITLKESIMSEEKRMRLINLIRKRFNDPEELSGGPSRERILEGYEEDSDHVMSLQMLKVYMASFWSNIHQQMPILHRPTFNADSCPDLLLLAMICLGASCLERTHTLDQTKHCADMSHFLAYHIRWEVFKDPEFRPTAKLWTFQTMLLLELFEKMYSTKTLHERAHIHHATTLIVMRRGSSLIGRSANENGQHPDPTRTPPGPDGTINTSGQNTGDPEWNKWITAEATRRVAFAAFIIDSTHATLFGHSAVMSPHDLKLPLPCDEALWAATSSAEVSRVEASLAANGFKPTTFIDGLKKTLNGQKVRTNTFGRQILMAGLLNVSWHMNQRDLQVSSLGAGNTLGNQYKWRAPLTRAFDFWRRDFDESLSKNEHWQALCSPKPATDRPSLDLRDNIFESRTCLHSLAHMAMHVDMVDCTVFAGSDRVLGRIVTGPDRETVQRRMKEQWAPSARARDSVFYALRFLCEVLIPEEDSAALRRNPSLPPVFNYSARDDYLLNRSWVLYFAALIVWSYGYALDGPIRPSNYTLTSREMQIFDMQRYLKRMGRVAAPDDLEKQKDRNSCLGLLMLLRQCFKEPRWELLHEAGDLLGKCIELLLPGNTEVKNYI
ncbi:hypothetical protein AMS68_005814 [Peltaster fructicola]|uniref:C2H2-type domain-containing protein n=1 Tax=Peltaster fructicola TaxID=286661 RepID=A0A6H0XZW7_9PEZI|nr:hypothetical protein AMS68_005814 [Peltaster fructicola]